MDRLASRRLAWTLAIERRRWRIAAELARESKFTPEQCRRILYRCRDDVGMARRVVHTAMRRGWSLAEARQVITEMIERWPGES